MNLENWHYLGAWLYFGPIFLLSYERQLSGDLSPAMRPQVSMAIYLVATLMTLVLRDGLMGEWFYPGWAWVYLGFLSYFLAAMVTLSIVRGFWGNRQKEEDLPRWSRVYLVGMQAIGVVWGSIGFFIISNFGVWWQSGLYARDLEGFLQCYWLALPFLEKTLSSDLVFAFLFFALVELVLRLSEKCKRSKIWANV